MTLPGSNFSQRRRPVNRRSLILRLVLLVVTWQGPLPFLHCHGTMANASGSVGMTGWLSGHLRAFHSSVAPDADVNFGWHAHVCLPQPPQDEESGRPIRIAQDWLPTGDSLGSSGAAHTLINGLVEVPCEFVSIPTNGRIPALTGPLDRSLSFYTAFAPALAVPVRFCVSRC